MALPREYRKFIGKYDECNSGYGRRMLRKFGFGPESEAEVVKDTVEETVNNKLAEEMIKKAVSTPKKKKKATTRKKKTK